MLGRGVSKAKDVPLGAAVTLKSHGGGSGTVLSSCLCHRRAAVTLGESLHRHRAARGQTSHGQEPERHNRSDRDRDVEERAQVENHRREGDAGH